MIYLISLSFSPSLSQSLSLSLSLSLSISISISLCLEKKSKLLYGNMDIIGSIGNVLWHSCSLTMDDFERTGLLRWMIISFDSVSDFLNFVYYLEMPTAP